MSANKTSTNIFAMLDEDLTFRSSPLPNYDEKEERTPTEKAEEIKDEDIGAPSITHLEQSEWQEIGSKKKKVSKKKSKKPINTTSLVKSAKIAPVYQIFQCPDDTSDFEILQRIHSVKIILAGGLRVVQDRNLVYGTKIRSMEFFYKLKDLGYSGVVMAAAPYAPSQISTAWMCAQAELKLHLFVSGCKNKLVTPYMKKAMDLGATIDHGKSESFTFRHYPRLKDAEATLDGWLEQQDKSQWFHLATGCADQAYMHAMTHNFLEIKEEYKLNPSEIWIVGITGLVAACLAKAFPETVVHCVSLSDCIWPDLFKTRNYRIHHYPSDLGGITAEYPFEVPFETTGNFGAKVMFFSKKMAPDALIWNVY